jgi:hypothetical protein
MKKIPTTEHDHQVRVIDWAELVGRRKYPMLRWLYAIPNGARTSQSVANRLKAEGMKAGVPDLCLPYPVHHLHFTYHGLFIEMKSKDTKGRVSKEQKPWLEYLESVGYKVAVAWSADEAIQIIEDYLNGKPSTTP